MIRGQVRNLQPLIELEVGHDGSREVLEGTVDTGLNGSLTLSKDLISSLQLPFAGHRRSTLGDGSIVTLGVYLARVKWHGEWREVLVLQAECQPLVGMWLLSGNRLTIDATEHGDVVIDELRPA